MEGSPEGKFLSIDEVASVVKNKTDHPSFNVLSYVLKPTLQELALLCDHCVLNTTVAFVDESGGTENSREEELSFFVKQFPKNPKAAALVGCSRAFEKEIFMYNLFDKYRNYGLTLIDRCTPACYLSQYNRHLILDNLQLENFRSPDKDQTVDYDTLITIIQSLAKLHACSLIYEERKSEESGKPYRLLDDHEEDLRETFYNISEDFVTSKVVRASIKSVIDLIDYFEHKEKLISGQNFKPLAHDLCYKIFDLVKPSTIYRNVASHGDLHAGNVLLRYDEAGAAVGCKFVDFQCARYAPPSHDLLSLVFLTTSRELRKNHLYEALGIYYANLEKLLKLSGYCLQDVLPFEDFLKSCEEQKLFAIVQAATHLPLLLINEENFIGKQEDGGRALFEDRGALIGKNAAEDEFYKRRLEEAIQDLRDYCQYM